MTPLLMWEENSFCLVDFALRLRQNSTNFRTMLDSFCTICDISPLSANETPYPTETQKYRAAHALRPGVT